MFAYLIQGAALGLTASVSPGPLLAYLINQSLGGGWKKGAKVALAPLLSDGIIVPIILLVLDQLPPLALRLIGVAGGLFVLYLAWGLWRQWRKGSSLSESDHASFSGNLGKAVLMNFLSPGPYLFWSLVNGPLLLSALRESFWHGLVFVVSFYGLFVGGMLGIAALLHQARRFGPRLVHWLTLASILILIVFGFLLLKQGILG
ncbi:MAG: LysE family transporter [Anaerolineales bacterium]|nr:LysE family transporter [Anaerolineales bacterium]